MLLKAVSALTSPLYPVLRVDGSNLHVRVNLVRRSPPCLSELFMTGQHRCHVDPSLLITNVPAMFDGGNVIRQVGAPATIQDSAYSTTRPRTLAPHCAPRTSTPPSTTLTMRPRSYKLQCRPVDQHSRLSQGPGCTETHRGLVRRPWGLQKTVSPRILAVSGEHVITCSSDRHPGAPRDLLRRPRHSLRRVQSSTARHNRRCLPGTSGRRLLLMPSPISLRRSAKLDRKLMWYFDISGVPSRHLPQCACSRAFTIGPGSPGRAGTWR
ncbi:hypothetical protein OH76DRAFT_523689 [Lentinus brumalis]|uniref:Uncharacterized protein n=1 Tax=Lentinus brumalis TaxID=2498619 RepID=A0A371DAX0_9APHY|nr:hypothetical protein OH76DRAFT_523689 [Polyporus brumalis]